mmetsp:Transcript_16812/g.38842  ORF Transcript_16812/g.38842 Transcript_16812/m.38842 type:complete len:259 (-) Transcript_16812:431-1207(-)
MACAHFGLSSLERYSSRSVDSSSRGRTSAPNASTMETPTLPLARRLRFSAAFFTAPVFAKYSVMSVSPYSTESTSCTTLSVVDSRASSTFGLATPCASSAPARPYANELRDTHVSPSSSPSSHSPEPTCRPVRHPPPTRLNPRAHSPWIHSPPEGLRRGERPVSPHPVPVASPNACARSSFREARLRRLRAQSNHPATPPRLQTNPGRCRRGWRVRPRVAYPAAREELARTSPPGRFPLSLAERQRERAQLRCSLRAS